MTKNIAPLKAQIESIKRNYDSDLEQVKSELFEIYKHDDEVNKPLRDLECMQGGEYDFDDYGELIYSVEVPSEIADLPFINDYLTRDYASISHHYGHNDLRVSQTCGGYIAVNWNHERDCYFVYDQETSKPIIEKHEEWMDERYVAAVIELYQHGTGCFGDVVKVCSRYGSYEGHFDTWEYLKEHEDHQYDEKSLKAIIDSYNQGETL